MASKKFTCNEVLGLLFADPDSEGEYLSSEDDGDSFSDHASDVSLPSNGAAGQNESVPLHQAQTLHPLPNVYDPLPSVSGGNNVSRGQNDHREVSRHVSGAGNEAGSRWVQSFYHASRVASLSFDGMSLRNRGDMVEPLPRTNEVRRG